MYKEVFLKSWGDLRKNLLLLVPDLLFGISMIIVGGLIVSFLGLVPFLSGLSETLKTINQGSVTEKEQAVDIIINLFKLNLNKVVTALISFALINFFIGAGFMCLKYNMMADVLRNKKLKLIEAYRKSKKKFWRFILLRIYIKLFYLIPFSFLVTTVIFYEDGVLGGIILGLLFFAYLVYSVFLGFTFYFTTPILFIKNLKAIEAIRESYNFLKLKTKYVLVIWLITILMFVGIIIVNNLLVIPFRILTLLFFVSIIDLLGTVVQYVVNVWKDMFRFRAYK